MNANASSFSAHTLRAFTKVLTPHLSDVEATMDAIHQWRPKTNTPRWQAHARPIITSVITRASGNADWAARTLAEELSNAGLWEGVKARGARSRV